MSARRKAAPPAPEPPVLEANYYHVLREMGLDVLVYGRYTTPNPENGSFWHPEIITGPDMTLIVWRKQGDPHNRYGFDGYTVQRGPYDFGGTYRTLAEALAWLLHWRQAHQQPTTGFKLTDATDSKHFLDVPTS